MAKSKIKTKEIDHGYKAILKELKKLEYGPMVKIGFPRESNKTNAQHEDSFVSVLDIAIVHEFGTSDGTIPERSFVRSAYDINRKKYEKLTKKEINKIYTGKSTVEKSLDILGQVILNDIKTFLTDNKVDPKTTLATLKARKGKRGGDKTLIDTAQMLNSLTYKRVMRP